MNGPLFLGVDCGTTVVKAALMDSSLRLVDEADEKVAVDSPFQGASQTNMQAVWDILCRVLRRLEERNPESWGRIAGVGVTGQGDGLWPVDSQGIPVRDALLWNDTRSKRIDFEGMPGLNEAIGRCHSNQVYAGSVVALLKWMQLYEPDNFRRVHKALHCKDWINFRLTGRLCTDYTDASTAVFDLEKGCYAHEMLDAMGMSRCREMLPEVVSSTQIIGHATPEAEKETGIPAGTPVIAGAIDVCAVALGTDLTKADRGCTIIGTTLGNEITLGKKDLDFSEKRGLLMYHAVPELYMHILPTLSGASTMDYMKDLLFPELGYPELEQMLDALPVGCDGLIYHPYICGERAPIKNPFATAGFFGLTQNHTKLQMMRSVFEGLACSFYDCYSVFNRRPDVLYLSGGASVSKVVCQMFSDMMNMPCRRVSTKELGILGVLRILLVALGYVKDFSHFPDQAAVAFTPDPQRHEQYLKTYHLFLHLREAMEPFWQKRSAAFGE